MQVPPNASNRLPSFSGIRKKNLEALYGQSRVDKSPKGSVDEHIRSLVDLINGNESYVTLSSCSGRICVYDPGLQPKDDCSNAIEERNDANGKGGNGGWLLASHDEIVLSDLVDCMAGHKMTSRASFRFEPFLLHVAAANLRTGQDLLQVALQQGLRESGLVVTKDRVTVALRTVSLQMTVPLTRDLPVSYLALLVREANERLLKNWASLCRLQLALDTLCAHCTPLVSSYLPDLKLHGHAAIFDHEVDRIVVFGGYGSGPQSDPPSRTKKIFSLSMSNSAKAWQAVDLVTDEDRVSVTEWTGRQGAAVAKWNQGVLIHGGRRGQALDDFHIYENGTFSSLMISSRASPSPRWGHTLTKISPDEFLLIGGRSTENVADDSVYLLSVFSRKHFVWKRVAIEDKQFRRYHHAALSLGNRLVLVHGGLTSTDTLDSSSGPFVVEIKTDGSVVKKLIAEPGHLGERFGHQLNLISSTVAKLYRIVLSGGVSGQTRNEINDAPFVSLTLYLGEEYATMSSTTLQTSLSCGTLVHHTAVSISDNTICIIGGGCQGYAFRDIYAGSMKLQGPIR